MTDPAVSAEPPVSLRELRARAEEVVTPEAWEYLETGAGAEVSLGEAESAWQRWRFRPYVLRDVAQVSTACRLLGQDLATPVLVAPTAYHEPYHPTAELGTAAGVRDAGSLLCLSTRSSRTVEQVAEHAGPWWLQVYVMTDRDITEAMVDRAVAAGASALVLTGDTPYVSRRARGSALPLQDEVALVNVQQHLAGRTWSSLEQDPRVTYADIEWLASRSGLPVLVKGVLRADEARACVAAGAAGVVVSNHGARQLDRVVPTALALPEVARAVADQVPVLVDGGIRSGHDVATALALGADAVLVGRPTMYALATGGAPGVTAMLRGLTAQLAEAMGLLGITSLAGFDRSLVDETR